MEIQSFITGEWKRGAGDDRLISNAVTGEAIGSASTKGFDFESVLQYARDVGGPSLRAMTFHQRALMLKALAKFLLEKKERFYEVSYWTGATRKDAWIDIEGGISTLFTYSSKGRRELPNQPFLTEGQTEPLSKHGTFVGQHIVVPLEGTALHINAFNFPCWGMLEKLAPTWLAGMPAVVKPATPTCYLTQVMVEEMINSGLIPHGGLQLICGGVGDIFDHLTHQDVVTFTGSAETGRKLKAHPRVIEESVRFNLEADSLNCAILGTDAGPGSEEFNLFVKEVVREVTVKAGQKCTAIRRCIVPAQYHDAVAEAISTKLAATSVGNPLNEKVRMGALAGQSQRDEVLARIEELGAECEQLLAVNRAYECVDADPQVGAFVPPVLLSCANPFSAERVHEIEAFGPVTTLLPYDSVDEAVRLAKMGKGSLVASLHTYDPDVATEITLGAASSHGRLLILDRDSAGESTGHGSPMPHLVHGGPGRAGGGEELGGIRSVMHYMQRTALQGSPTVLSRVCRKWIRGAKPSDSTAHPFTKHFEELSVGDQLITHRRTITEADIVNFAGISGDHFYAHLDEIGARESLFEGRVAHGYLVLSIAAGLFVYPNVGPVLANYGLESLRFTEPVRPGDTIHAVLTCAEKTPKEGEDRGVVSWDVEVINQESVTVASYTILTLVQTSSVQESPE